MKKTRASSRREDEQTPVIYSPCGKYYYDAADAQRYIDFFPRFAVHVKGELRGQPLDPLPWFVDDVLKPLFGWKRVEDGFRKHTEGFIFIARKNSKTLNMAGLALAVTVMDGELGAEVYCVASTEEQARVLFGMSSEMVTLSPKLSRILKVYEGAGLIEHRPSGSFFRVLHGRELGQTGTNPHALFIDELHEFKNYETIEAIRTGMAARNQPLTLMTTTAGKSTAGPAYQEYKTAKAILKGDDENPEYLPVIYEAHPDDPWDQEETWKKANPGYGLSVKKRYFENKLRKARRSETEKVKFLQFNVNRWQGKANAFIKMEAWRKCIRQYTLEDLKGLRCFGGLDLADTNDHNAFALIFPMVDERGKVYYLVLVWYWIPQETADRRAEESSAHREWLAKEFLKTTPGARSNQDIIRADIKEIVSMFDVVEVGYDPYNAFTMCNKLAVEDGIEMVEVRPGTLTMNAPIKELDILISEQRLQHNDHPVLNFNVENAMVVRDAKQNLNWTKEDQDDKIDGLVAVTIALSRAMVAPPPRPPKKMRVID